MAPPAFRIPSLPLHPARRRSGSSATLLLARSTRPASVLSEGDADARSLPATPHTSRTPGLTPLTQSPPGSPVSDTAGAERGRRGRVDQLSRPKHRSRSRSLDVSSDLRRAGGLAEGLVNVPHDPADPARWAAENAIPLDPSSSRLTSQSDSDDDDVLAFTEQGTRGRERERAPVTADVSYEYSPPAARRSEVAANGHAQSRTSMSGIPLVRISSHHHPDLERRVAFASQDDVELFDAEGDEVAVFERPMGREFMAIAISFGALVLLSLAAGLTTIYDWVL